MIEINAIVKEWYNWKHYKIGKFDVWFNGYILNGSKTLFLNKGVELLKSTLSTNNDFDCWMKDARGHFSFIITDHKKKILCGVDRVNTIPIFYHLNNIKAVISNYAPDISKVVDVDKKEHNYQAILEIAMSAYTIGKKTIHPKISQLCAGEFLILREGDTAQVRRYYQYSPWKTKEKSKAQLKNELTEVSRQILKDMVKNADGRQIVIPLSAGNDSRFIASGLKELKVKNVFCFSYGINNNFEVETAKKIAEKLDYQWLYVPLSIKSQTAFFKEKEFDDFWKFTDTLSNSPVLIDYSAVKKIKESGKISKDAIFVNGNAGDFITGNHLMSNCSLSGDKNKSYLIESILKKHYSLWNCLKTVDNVNAIKSELEKEVSKLMNDYALSWSNFSEIGESMEWLGRQSKFVTTTQRSYEFHGYNWMLPMWDAIYMDFWESVPKRYKSGQSLYIETLRENNWGGVWGNIQVNNKRIASNKLKTVRNFSKIFFAFSGKDAWHQFDKKYFSYFYDNTAGTAIISYKHAFFDRCGFRSRNSWIAKRYLYEKGIDINSEFFFNDL